MKLSQLGLGLLALVLTLVQVCTGAGILAIDYGTDAFKVSLVKPGTPFDVLINPDSKRKTPNVVYLKENERVYGGEAVNLAVKRPQHTYSSVKLLLGEPADGVLSQFHETMYKTPVTVTDRGTRSAGNYSAEELVAMHFAYAKELAEVESKDTVTDAVVTVPAWFNVTQRQALLAAVELAGLTPLALIHDGSAVAINFAVSRTFDTEPVHYLLYDFGAGPIEATIVSIHSEMRPPQVVSFKKPKKSDYVNTTIIDVQGYGFDVGTSGYLLDKAVRDILASKFEQTVAKLPQGDPKVNAKLLKEAGRVKHILSANTESVTRIEGLYDDLDFRGTVARNELEQHLGSGFTDALKQPIYDALKEAKLTVDQLGSIILTGGNTRVPFVQKAIADVVGPEKVAVNVNADEAAVMGAALFGANVSRAFRTKPMVLNDKLPYAYDYSVDNGKTKKPLFEKLAEFGSHATVSLPYPKNDDATYEKALVTLYEADNGSDKSVGLFNVTALSKYSQDAVANLTTEEKASAHIDIDLTVSLNGLVKVTRSELVVPAQKKGSLLSGLFGGKKDANATEEVEEKQQRKTIALSVITGTGEGLQMTPTERAAARKRLRDLKLAERLRAQREESRNTLEALVYKVRDLLTLDEFLRHTSSEEKATMEKASNEFNEWLWEEGDTAETKAFQERIKTLNTPLKKVQGRKQDHEQADSLVEEFVTFLIPVESWSQYARNHTETQEAEDQPVRWERQVLDKFDNLISETREWLNSLKDEHSKRKPHEDAAVTRGALTDKRSALNAEWNRLQKIKPKRKTPPVKPAAEPEPESTTEQEQQAHGSKTEDEPNPEPEEMPGQGHAHKPEETPAPHDPEDL